MPAINVVVRDRVYIFIFFEIHITDKKLRLTFCLSFSNTSSGIHSALDNSRRISAFVLTIKTQEIQYHLWVERLKKGILQ